jgi:DnaJ-class molecular chaperone
MDYYKILEVDETSTKEEIKRKYRYLCLQYHPDKNNGEDEHFKKINEAYETLIDDEKRDRYNISRYFGKIEFTEEDYRYFKKYYDSFLNSNEFKLMKLLYKSIPEKIKTDLWKRFQKVNQKSIVKLQKTIDVTSLFDDLTINLVLSKEDYDNQVLKIIHIISNTGIYYLYLREYYDLEIDNNTCFVKIHFFIRE